MSSATGRASALWALAALAACGGGNGDSGGAQDEAESCPSIACSPALTVELSPPLGVGSYRIDYAADGSEVSCSLELQSVAPLTCGGAAGAPCGSAAPMTESDCDELVFAFEIDQGRMASLAFEGEPASFDVEISRDDGNVLGSGSFQPSYDEEDEGCGCGGTSVTLELGS